MSQIFLASDHAGFALKGALATHLQSKGYTVEDMGPHEYIEGDDYPDYCIPIAKKVAQNKDTFGIVVGMSGQGEAMACNRVRGARAVVYYGGESEVLTLSRQHNNANILSLGAKFFSEEDAAKAVEMWLATPFSGDERHIRRIEKLDHD